MMWPSERDEDEALWNIYELISSRQEENISSILPSCRSECHKIASAALHSFILSNFVVHSSTASAPPEYIDDQFVRSKLDVDNESVSIHVRNAHMLLIVECIASRFPSDAEMQRIFLRASVLLQTVLPEPSPTLFERINGLVVSLVSGHEDSSEGVVDLASIHLEASIAFSLFDNLKKSKEHLEKAQSILNLGLKLNGVMGRRTKFQSSDKVQLVLDVVPNGSDSLASQRQPIGEEDSKCLPSNVSIEDDVLLSTPRLNGRDAVPSLSALEQGIILAFTNIVDAENAQKELKAHEIMAFLDVVLERPLSLNVTSVALLRRSQIEAKLVRSRLRSLQQLEELVACRSRFEALNPRSRSFALKHFFMARPVPTWSLKVQLAKQHEELGMSASALVIYEELECWEEMVTCYIRTGRRAKVAEMLRLRLEEEMSPRLLCILGDVTNDISHYEQAWKLSGQRYSRAERSLAEHYFAKEQFEDALEHYKKALEINPHFPKCWYAYGYSALRLERYETMIGAFSRCVAMDADYADAWNNLAAAYLHSDQPIQAFEALKQCTRLKRDDWKIWDNFLTAAIRIGDVQSALVAVDRLMVIDVSRLEISAVGAVVHLLLKLLKERPVRDAEVEFTLRRSREVLDKLTARITNNAELYSISASLFEATNESSNALKMRLKLCQALEFASWKDNIVAFEALSKALLSAARLICLLNLPVSAGESVSLRLQLQRVISLAAQHDFSDSPQLDALQNELERLSDTKSTQDVAAAAAVAADSLDERDMSAIYSSSLYGF